MPEKLEEILKNGFSLWRKNLKISLPFLFDLIAEIIIASIFLILAIFLAIILLFSLSSISDISDIQSYIDKFAEAGIGVILIFAVILIIFLLITQLINSFFCSGAIGMAKTAIESGKTGISDMLNYGKRKFLDLFFANLIVFLIYILGILIFLPFIISIFLLNERIIALILFFIGIIGILIYLTVVSIVLSPVQYAVVISDTKAIDGIKKGFRFFMNNKFDVFLLWLLIFLISIAISIFTGILQFIAELISILGWIFSILIAIISTLISVLIIAPLSAVWWTKLYIDRK